MKALFSTTHFPVKEGPERWTAGFEEASGWPFPASPIVDPSRFYATVSGNTIDSTLLLTQKAAPYQLIYGKKEASFAQDRPTTLLLLCQSGELHVEVGKERLRARTGEILLLDLAQPIKFQAQGDNQTVKIPLDRERLHLRDGRPIGTLWKQHQGFAGLIGAYIHGLTLTPDEHLLRHGALLSTHLHEVVAASLTLKPLSAQTALERQSLAAARRTWIGQWLNTHYSRPYLTAEHAAQAAGISVRYLHRLLESDGTSFTRELGTRRLKAARAALENPHDPRSLTTIAHDCGFCDAAHFSRTFRSAFGITPSEYRAEAALATHNPGRNAGEPWAQNR